MSDPMLIDFQLGASSLLTVVRNELRRSLHFCTDPFQVKGLGTVYLDHVEVPTASGFSNSQLPFASGFVHRSSQASKNSIISGEEMADGTNSMVSTDVPTFDPEIVVPIRLHFTSDDRVINGEAAVTMDMFVIHLIFGIDAEMIRNQSDRWGNPLPWTPNFSIQVTNLDFGQIGDYIQPEDQQRIRGMVLGKSVPLPVDLQPIKALLQNKIPLNIFNVGASINVPPQGSNHATCFAVRWEVNGPSDSLGGWSSFLNGDFGVGLSDGNSCFLSVPAGLFTAWSEATFSESLAEQASQPDAQFDVTTWPSAVWTPWGMQTSFDIDVHVPLCPNDVGVTVQVATTFSLAQGELVVVSAITHDANDWDVFVCSALQGPPSKLFDTIAGAIAAAVYNPDVTQYVHNLPSGCAWSEKDKEITCTFPLALPFGDVAVTITALVATFDGLILSGIVDVQETKPLTPWFNPKPTLAWTSPGLCDDFVGYVGIPLAAIYPPGLICSFTVVDDPLHQFTPFVDWNEHVVNLLLREDAIVGGYEQVVTPGSTPGSVIGKPGFPEGSYFNDPYPLHIIIRTTDGIQLVKSTNDIPLPPKPPNLTLVQQAELAGLKKLNCQTWAVWQPEQIFKPRWWPDPPWRQLTEGSVHEHLWRVLVSGVNAGHEVEASGTSGQVATAIAGAHGLAHLDLLLAEGTDEGFLVSARLGAGNAGEGTGALRIAQALLVPMARIPLTAPAQDLALSAFSPGIAWCVTAAGTIVYRIDQLTAPTIVQRIDEYGVRGLVPLARGRFLTWGLRGLYLHDSAARQPTQTLISELILDVAYAKRRFFALTTNFVAAYDDLQQEARKWPRPDGATLLGCTQRALVLGSTQGLAIYDRRVGDSARIVAEVDVTDATALVSMDGVGRDNEVVVRRRGGCSLVLDLSDPAAPHPAASIVQDRWSSVRRLGKTVARPSEDGSLIELYRLDREVLLNRMQIEEGVTAGNHRH